MSRTPPPFAAFEWMIAWRYLRASRAQGGVSTMTVISLLGITLAVFALIATLSVRAGFRAEFVDTILGANAHVSVIGGSHVDADGRTLRGFADYEAVTERLRALPGVTSAAPVVRGQVMANANGRNAGVEIYGMRAEDIAAIPRIADGGELARLEEGIAIGQGVAQELGVTVGDRIRLISPDGARTAFGTSPRVNSYEVVHVFSVGRWDIDRTRVYLPLAEAQGYLNREGLADEVQVSVTDPEQIERHTAALLRAGGENAYLWTWRDSAGAFLRALDIEDNVMFVIMSVLVLIATLNIVSGLIMLVKNKGRDIGILRTMGLTEGSILRIFFLCGASTGVVGTALGVGLGCLFAIHIDTVFSAINWMSGGQAWDPSIRGIYALPALLRVQDVVSAVALSLGLSFVVTIFPARRAARMNPVEALRYE